MKIIRHISPAAAVSISFLLLICTGTALLMLPGITHKPISFIDALFTATSSVCVTGLIVLDTAADFTLAGQALILGLIQLGGLGIMTVSLALILFVSRKISVRWQFTLMDMYGKRKKLPIRMILKNILLFTFVCESAVTLLLLPVFLMDFPAAEAVWHSVFHAVSSFCNAGFSTFSDSLVSYSNNWYLILVVSFSIITGGLGFLVLSDIARNFQSNLKKAFSNYSLHTKVVIVTSVLLIVSGTLFIFIFEYNNILKALPLPEKLCVSFFQSVSCRTAGFNSVPIGGLNDNTLFFMVLLMVIGGSPGSIAGGIKTTTAWVICAILIGRIRNTGQLVFWNRAISSDTTERSTTLLILALLFITVTSLFLSGFHNTYMYIPFIDILFESASAFGTVGLSSGVTGHLTFNGKFVIIITMFLGRIGPLTFLSVISSGNRQYKVRYPEENMLIG